MTKAEAEPRPAAADRAAAVVGAPLVSVVVTSYNHAPYVQRCLSSIFEQSYPAIECIVVDNASTDGSAEAIGRFAETRDRDEPGRTLEIVLSPVNGHLTRAMVQGFARTNGAYVLFVDGDDFLLPTCVETHVSVHLVSRIAVGFTSVDMYQSRGEEIVTGTGKHVAEYVMSGLGQRSSFCRMGNLGRFVLSRQADPAPLRERDLHLVDPSMSAHWVWSPTSALCFRREAVDLMFACNPQILSHTDAYLARGITSLMGSIVIDRPLAVYRLHGANMFSTHPWLANFTSYNKKDVERSDAEVSAAVVDCFRLQAGSLAARLAEPDLFIQAVEQVAHVGLGLRPRASGSTFTLEFLHDNRDALVAAFGRTVYRRWRLRYAFKSWHARIFGRVAEAVRRPRRQRDAA
jgi:glycosyltransferase involved in cell wall biosynthesis